MSKLTIKDFEQSLDQLEKIVVDMENEDMPLDKALGNFKDGIKLVQKCEKAIKQAKQTVDGLIDDVGDAK